MKNPIKIETFSGNVNTGGDAFGLVGKDVEVAGIGHIPQVNLNISVNVNINNSGDSSTMAEDGKAIASKDVYDKGNGKMYTDCVFNRDGLLTKEAIKLINDELLTHLSKGFQKKKINLEDQIAPGISIKEVLNQAIQESINAVTSKVQEVMKNKGERLERHMTRPICYQ